MNKSIYLAGPIGGLTYDGATNWRDDLKHFFAEHNIDAFSPMRGKIFLAEMEEMPDSFDKNLLSSQKVITTRDRNDCINCDLLFINFTGAQKPSKGTCIEIGWADANQIPIIAVTGGDEHHDHAMINELCIRVDTLEEAKLLALQFLSTNLDPQGSIA